MVKTCIIFILLNLSNLKKKTKKTVDLTHVMQDSGVHHFGHLLVQFGHL